MCVGKRKTTCQRTFLRIEFCHDLMHGGDGGLHVAFHGVVSGARFVVEMTSVWAAVVVEVIFWQEYRGECAVAVFFHSFVEGERCECFVHFNVILGAVAYIGG